jgi:hypothetical protein
VRGWFKGLDQRGVRMFFVYSAADAGLDELALYTPFRNGQMKFLPDARLAIIDGADHNLTARAAREIFTAHLVEFFVGRGKRVKENTAPRLSSDLQTVRSAAISSR